MQSREVHSSASALEEAPITLTRGQLAMIVKKAMEDALPQGSGKTSRPSPPLQEQGGAKPYVRDQDFLPPDNKERKEDKEEYQLAKG